MAPVLAMIELPRVLRESLFPQQYPYTAQSALNPLLDDKHTGDAYCWLDAASNNFDAPCGSAQPSVARVEIAKTR